MKIKIPQKIEVLGSTIDIVWDNDYCERSNLLGEADNNHNRILLKEKHENILIKDDALEETFIHELVHLVFRKIGRKDLYDDETLVESLSNTLHQVIKQL